MQNHKYHQSVTWPDIRWSKHCQQLIHDTTEKHHEQNTRENISHRCQPDAYFTTQNATRPSERQRTLISTCITVTCMTMASHWIYSSLAPDSQARRSAINGFSIPSTVHTSTQREQLSDHFAAVLLSTAAKPQRKPVAYQGIHIHPIKWEQIQSLPQRKKPISSGVRVNRSCHKFTTKHDDLEQGSEGRK